MYSKDHGREEHGVLISSKENMRFVPHLTIKVLMRFNQQGRDAKFIQYHFGYRGSHMAITYCYHCRGVGKFDWIQQTSDARRPKWGEARMYFTRDEEFYYAYPDFNNYLFAKAKVEPGDIHCTKCHGFGLELDGRYKIFRGMIGIKKRLVQIEATNY